MSNDKPASGDWASYLGLYQSFQSSEHHFNDVQAGLRKLASSWMLAALGGVAFVLHTDKDTSWLVEPHLLVALIACAAAMGMIVLYILDQLVYQRLLNSVFVMAAYWEYTDKSLPITRLIMRDPDNRGMSRWVIWFYRAPIYLFLLISVVTFIRLDPGKWTWVWAVAIVLQVCAIAFLENRKDEVRAKKFAKKFNNTGFYTLFDESQDSQGAMEELLKGRDFGQGIRRGAVNG